MMMMIPSSTPVERLFSTGGQILTPRRNGLTDEHFQMLLICSELIRHLAKLFLVIEVKLNAVIQ